MFENRDRLARSPPHDLALSCLEAGIEAAHPRHVVAEGVALDGDRLRVADASYDLDAYDEVLVVGGGKAAAQVAVALEAILGDRIDGGVVVTNDPEETDRVTVVEGDHPVPSERGVAGARQVLTTASEAGDRTLVLAVLTGGASALLPAPVTAVSLDDLRTTTERLLESGATIDEINAVRKHLSIIKGGQMARTADPATVVGLLFSDVVGDDPGVIGSGPTAPDPTTFEDAFTVLARHSVGVPDAVSERIEAGTRGEHGETPGADADCFERVDNHVLANAWTAIAAAREIAREGDHRPLVLSSRIRGEASEAATAHVAVAEECLATGNPVEPPAVVLSGGETTVTVRGDGEGGPNQEFALSAALDLPEGAVLATADTDGIDGVSDAAGALVDADTVPDRVAAERALIHNDAYPYLDDRDALLVSGPTGTNVNDLRVLVVGSR
ncbi:glycerate kinase [Halobacteriales archaeon QS_1_68_17]|nr:MAG: glycerate kinase [Halobacteriales archaeon QS_1_68_17]